MENRKAELLLVLGAVVSFIGPALEFFSLTAAQTIDGKAFSQTGYESGDSSTYVIVGVVALICAVVTFATKSGGLRKVMGVLATLAGILGVYAGYIDMTGGSTDIDIGTGVGTYVVIVGGLLVLVGGIFLFKSPTTTAAAAPAAPPAAPPPPA